MSDASASTGARLTQAREQRNMSREKAAGELHLDPWVIEALEAGDYARIGPEVYGKGFLRRYAMLLDLPAEEILAGFGLAAPAVNEASGVSQETPALPAFSSGQLLGGVIVALLLGGLAWWKPWTSTAKNPAPAEPVATARAPEIAPEPLAALDLPAAAEQPITRALAATAPAERDVGSAAADEPGAGRARLRLSFTADSWVDIRDAQGKKSFVGNGSANTVRTIAGQGPMHVYLRSGSAVQLEINGHAVAIGPQFFAGDVARFQAGADGVLRREPRETSAFNGRPPS